MSPQSKQRLAAAQCTPFEPRGSLILFYAAVPLSGNTIPHAKIFAISISSISIPRIVSILYRARSSILPMAKFNNERAHQDTDWKGT